MVGKRVQDRLTQRPGKAARPSPRLTVPYSRRHDASADARPPTPIRSQPRPPTATVLNLDPAHARPHSRRRPPRSRQAIRIVVVAPEGQPLIINCEIARPRIVLCHAVPNPHSHTPQLRPPSKSPHEIDSALAILDPRPRHLPPNYTRFRTRHLSPNTSHRPQPNLENGKPP